MIDSILAVLIWALVPFAWVSTAVLVYAARQRPRIGALTERSVIALIIAAFLTSIALIVLNTESGYVILSAELARSVFRVTVLLLGTVPFAWCLLWLTGRLGG